MDQEGITLWAAREALPSFLGRDHQKSYWGWGWRGEKNSCQGKLTKEREMLAKKYSCSFKIPHPCHNFSNCPPLKGPGKLCSHGATFQINPLARWSNDNLLLNTLCWCLRVILFIGFITVILFLVMFKFPLWRDFVMAGGVCDVSKESIRHIVTKQGTGNAAVIVVGGAAESLDARPGSYTLTLKSRKGFAKMALQTG